MKEYSLYFYDLKNVSYTDNFFLIFWHFDF